MMFKEITFKEGELLIDVLLRDGCIKSRSQFRRLIEQGAIEFTPEENKCKQEFQNH